MSYRSLKRVLGETSLERKCRFLFGACLFLLITASFWFYGGKTEKIVNEQNRVMGRLLVDQEMSVLHWKSLESAKIGTEYMDLVKKLSDSFNQQRYDVKFLLPNQPVPKDNDRDNAVSSQEELAILKWFMERKPRKSRDPDSIEFREQKSADGNTYYYYQPIRATGSECFIGCHQPMGNATGDLSTGLSVFGKSVATAKGDLMAVARLNFSTKATRTSINWNRAMLISTAILTVFAAMVVSYAIVRYVIVKPLRHLRDTSDAISRGNATLRANIHTGDEFEELATAFNRMLRHLTGTQEELQLANVNLDNKVDELAQANMRLYELNMLKSDFLATMSHELRTPLNSILGFSDVLGSIDSLDDKQKRYVQNIQKSGKTLLEMINDILDLAKIESGKMETRLIDFQIATVVHAQCDMARPLIERKNIDLTCEAEADLPPMHQDQARVQQILNNLLSNAIKFTPEGGRIDVAAKRDETEFLVLSISDTGVGIAEEEQQAIFEKFRQGKTAMPSGDAMTREYSGSGLGLSIVKELCRLLGGEVLVQSQLGKGSVFTVRLPWTLEDQPRLDTAMAEGLEEFSKQRLGG
ncbi:MAG: HAMP domain-containing histidine kinase [Planctomycetaceae bacterium]|nr:HAMP domain-containing histidine kinase [Planctomycetaceae bacterium]